MKQIARVGMLLVGLLLGSAAQAGKVTYIHTDIQGTPVMESDAQGNITARFDYTPYGVPVQGLSGPPNGPGYTGHVNDPDTGFVYMQARYYDPTEGIFLSVDPVGPKVGNEFNFGRYVYANDNPVNFIDPLGRECQGESGECAQKNKNKSPPVSPIVQRMRDTSNCGGCIMPSADVYQAYYSNLDNGKASMDGAGHVADAIGSTIFGLPFNMMKRPSHPTKLPNKLAHQLFMTGAAGDAVALSPYPFVMGALTGPIAVEGAGSLAAPMLLYGPRAALIGCLSISCMGEETPDQFAADREMLQEIYEDTRIMGQEIFKKVIESDK